jgi:putative PIN family toxin of toxin-antitoxin system
LQTAENRLTEVIVTAELQDELWEVIRRSKFKRYFEQCRIDPEQLMSKFMQAAQQVTSVKITDNPVRDGKDLKFLECAPGGNADYLISGDQDLLTLRQYKGIQIVTPAQFLSILTSLDSETDISE